MKKIYYLIFTFTFSIGINAQSLKWVNGVGGTGFDQGFTIAVDSNNNIYQGIHFENTVDFDPSTNTINFNSKGNKDIAICKYNPRGELLWAKQIGGTKNDFIEAIEVDRNGDVYIAGMFKSTVDFNPSTTYNFNLSSAGSDDIYLCKLNKNGKFIWAKRIGGTGIDQAFSIAIDESNNVLVSGKYTGTVDFDPSNSVANLTSKGWMDCYILKLSSNGDFIWAKSMGGRRADESGNAIKTDYKNNVFIVGEFGGVCDFDPSSSTNNETSNGSYDAFICKLDSNGNFQWVKTYGGNQTDRARSIYISKSEDILISGNFNDTVDFDPGSSTYNLSSNGDTDGYIQKLDQNGNFIWANSIGGSSIDGIEKLVEDQKYNIISTGRFYLTVDFDPDTNQYNLTATASDAFALKLDSSGNFVWAIQFGGSGNEIGNDILIDQEGRLICSGSFDNNTDFDPSATTYIVSSNGYRESYLLKLSPCPELYDTILVTSCGNYFSPSGNFEWTNSGTYSDTINSVEGCDSIINFNLTVNPGGFYTFNKSSCYSYNSPSGKYIWNQSGVYFDTVTTIPGCDSVFTINLTIDTSTTFSLHQTACDSFQSPSGKTYTTSGLIYDTIPNVSGCDSISIINLNIKNSTNSILNISTCINYWSPSNKLYINSGTYIDTIPNFVGCDSIIQINLSIVNSIIDTLFVSNCYSYLSPSGKFTWYQNGIYSDTVLTNPGCDSIYTIFLTIDSSSSSFFSVSACNTYTTPSGKTYTSSGLLYDTIPNNAGCDSIITIFLTIKNNSNSILNIASCNNYHSPSNKLYTVSGTYFDTILNTFGCDSIIELNIHIDSIDDAITQIGNQLISNQNNANYQWLDCNNLFTPLPNDTNQSFTSYYNGSYAVDISNSLCIDTSACINLLITGIDKTEKQNDIKIYPNPANDILTIDGLNKINNIRLIALNGKTIKLDLTNNNVVDISQLSNGIYFLKISVHDSFYMKKVIINH